MNKLIVQRIPGCKLPLPAYKTKGAAAFDLQSNMLIPITISNAKPVLIDTGFKFIIPEGHYGQLQARSGLAVQGVDLLAGVIDSDYRGQVKAVLTLTRNGGVTIHPGERICQMVIHKLPVMEIEEGIVDAEDTTRGEGGFGSTGK